LLSFRFTLLSTLFPPPLAPTLFSYTTLFRSPPYDAFHPILVFHHGQGIDLLFNQPVGRIYQQIIWITYGYARFTGHDDTDRCFLDRKSTRLNSSHVSISYAVFFLTKKIHMLI